MTGIDVQRYCPKLARSGDMNNIKAPDSQEALARLHHCLAPSANLLHCDVVLLGRQNLQIGEQIHIAVRCASVWMIASSRKVAADS